VDYRPVSIRMELPKEFRSHGVAVKETDEPVSSGLSYEEIMTRIRAVVQRLVIKELYVKATDSDWYNHANRIIPELLGVHRMKDKLISKYVAFHYLDKLSLSDKLVLVGRLFLSSSPSSSMNAYETIVHLYFTDLVLEIEDMGEKRRAIVLADGETNRLFLLPHGESAPVAAEYTDEQLFAAVRKERFVVPYTKINKTEIGFMAPFKGKEVVFKTKDMTQKRNNKGAKCTDSSKMVIANKIGQLMGQPTLYQSTNIERPELCVMLEMLMRWKTESSKTAFFFGPEKTNEMDLANLRF